MNELDKEIRPDSLAEKLAGLLRLRELSAKREKLLAELEASVRLRDFWPQCFDGGSCKVRLEGIVGHPEAAPSKWTLVLTNADGVVRRDSLDGVPEAVWRPICADWPVPNYQRAAVDRFRRARKKKP